MTPEQRASLVDRLAPVVVGALLAAIPTLMVSYFQSRAALRQLVVDRQFAVLKEFSAACARHVELSKRALSLSDLVATLGPSPPKDMTDRIIGQYESLGREIEEVRISLHTQAHLANSVFGVQISLSQEPVPETLRINAADAKRLNENLRASVPTMATRCSEIASLLISKLDR